MASLAQSIVITGASRGIGLEFVRQLAKASPKVLIAGCRNPAGATDLQEIAKENKCVKIVQLDVSNDADIDAAVHETKSLVGNDGLNLLINNAGIYLGKPDGGGIRQQTRERLQQHFDVNATSPIIVTQKFLPLLELAASNQATSPLGCSKAATATLSSIMGSQEMTYKGSRGTPLDYKCSKSAVSMANIIMSKDLKDSGILVLTLHPGWVKTDMGGPQGPVSEQESVEGLLKVLRNAGEKDTGLMIDYKGEVVPF